MRIVHIGLYFIILLLSFSCDNFMSGTPSHQFYSSAYMSLDVGDVRQIISVQDSSTLLWTIFGKTYRKDGEMVYCMEWKSETVSRDTLYYIIKDGYFLGTELDTTSRTDIDIRVNPFNEQRLAKLYPSNGEVFVHTPGELDSMYWYSRKEDPIKTFCGVFDDVYSFSLFGNLESMQMLKTYYARGFGYIGTAGFYSTDIVFSVSYIKLKHITIGNLWPEKDFGDGFNTELKKDIYEFLINGFLLHTKNMKSVGSLNDIVK